MAVKVFRAATTKEALMQIAEALGMDAVVVSRRVEKDHLGNCTVEINATSSHDSVASNMGQLATKPKSILSHWSTLAILLAVLGILFSLIFFGNDDTSDVQTTSEQWVRKGYQALKDAVGMYGVEKKPVIEMRLDEALTSFRWAIERDSTNARAYVGMAKYMLVHDQLYNSNPKFPNTIISETEKYLEKALSLEANLPEAYAVRGQLRHQYLFEFKGAEQDYLRAIQSGLENHDVLPLYINLHILNGDFRRAIDLAKSVFDDGNASERIFLMWFHCHFYQGSFAEAQEVLRLAEEAFPSSLLLLSQNFWLSLAVGDDDMAMQWATRIVLNYSRTGDLGKIKSAYDKGGIKAALQVIYRNYNSGYDDYTQARYHTLMDEEESAIDDLMRCFTGGKYADVILSAYDPILAPLKNHSRFLQLHSQLDGKVNWITTDD